MCESDHNTEHNNVQSTKCLIPNVFLLLQVKEMDRLQALRDTANLPRAVAPPPAVSSPVTSGGMERSLNDSGLDLRMDDSLTDMQWLQRMDAGELSYVK